MQEKSIKLNFTDQSTGKIFDMITIKAAETFDEFVFTIIEAWMVNTVKLSITKQELVDALTMYRSMNKLEEELVQRMVDLTVCENEEEIESDISTVRYMGKENWLSGVDDCIKVIHQRFDEIRAKRRDYKDG